MDFTENTRIASAFASCRKAGLVHLVMPAAVPLRLPRLCEPFEDALLYHLDGLALDHEVESSLPLVATGHPEDSDFDPIRDEAAFKELVQGNAAKTMG